MALTQIPSAMVTPDAGLTRAHMNSDAAIPAGVCWPYAGSSAPAGWLLCDGSAVSRTTYAALFSAIGATYGAGDGSTTFNLPDARGRVLAGKDNMGGSAASRLTSGGSGVDGATLGASGGAETHTLTTTQIPAHDHSAGAPSLVGITAGSTGYVGATGSRTGSTGGGAAHNNTQPTLITNYIIKT